MQENVDDLLWVDTDRLGGRVCFKGTRLSLVFMVNQREAYGDLEQLKQDYTLTDAQWALVEREHEHACFKPERATLLTSMKLDFDDLPEPPPLAFQWGFGSWRTRTTYRLPPDFRFDDVESEDEEDLLEASILPAEGHTEPLTVSERPKLPSVSWAFHNAMTGRPAAPSNPCGFEIPKARK